LQRHDHPNNQHKQEVLSSKLAFGKAIASSVFITLLIYCRHQTAGGILRSTYKVIIPLARYNLYFTPIKSGVDFGAIKNHQFHLEQNWWHKNHRVY